MEKRTHNLDELSKQSNTKENNYFETSPQQPYAYQSSPSYPQEELFNQDSFNYESTQSALMHAQNILDDPNIMKSDLLTVLSTAQGRRFLRRIFRSCGVFDYIPIGDQALYAWHEGRRSIGLIVYHSIFELGANFINQLLSEDRNNI